MGKRKKEELPDYTVANMDVMVCPGIQKTMADISWRSI